MRPAPLRGRRLARAAAPVVWIAAPAAAVLAVLLGGLALALVVAQRRLDDAARATASSVAAMPAPRHAHDPPSPRPPGPPPRADAVTVEVPEAYELANVVLTLTEFTERHPHTVFRRGAYHEAVAAHFGPFRSHPLVARLNARLQGERDWYAFLSFRENGASYAFDGDRLVRSPDYPPRLFGAEDVFTEELALVEDFARQAGFRAFHARHRPYHDHLVRRYRAEVPVEGMWRWLERRFPERYDRYRVVFSPLVHGTHSTRRIERDGERQTIMFVAGPHVASDTLPAGVRAAELARIVFTEIDHNYVNPATDRHRALVDEAFAPHEAWNAERQSMYGSPHATFNEYMTWGVFVLYARESYDAATFDAVRRDVERLMSGPRGFVRFAAFDARLLDAAAAAGPAAPIEALYAPMLRWAVEQRGGGRVKGVGPVARSLSPSSGCTACAGDDRS